MRPAARQELRPPMEAARQEPLPPMKADDTGYVSRSDGPISRMASPGGIPLYERLSHGPQHPRINLDPLHRPGPGPRPVRSRGGTAASRDSLGRGIGDFGGGGRRRRVAPGPHRATLAAG